MSGRRKIHFSTQSTVGCPTCARVFVTVHLPMICPMFHTVSWEALIWFLALRLVLTLCVCFQLYSPCHTNTHTHHHQQQQWRTVASYTGHPQDIGMAALLCDTGKRFVSRNGGGGFLNWSLQLKCTHVIASRETSRRNKRIVPYADLEWDSAAQHILKEGNNNSTGYANVRR